jgi:uncharacterized protein YdhG (YjbR/CyaY superfamily)
MSPAKKGGTKSAREGFSAEEKAAARATVRERQVDWAKLSSEEAERLVLGKIAEFPEPDRSIGKRVHAIVKEVAPGLKPRLWYGMPGYTKDGDLVCYFQNASKFKARYQTLGFADESKLDDGQIWPVVYAITEMTPGVAAKIGALVRKAVA